ncbi:MAG: hypothetical protein QM790_18820 [Nibricoccus sp.]
MFKSYVHHPKLLAYFLPGPIWAIGMIVASVGAFPQSKLVMPVAFVLGYLAIIYATFEFGLIRGYPARNKEGVLSVTNVMRCSVMSVIMAVPASFIAFPFLFGAAAVLK